MHIPSLRTFALAVTIQVLAALPAGSQTPGGPAPAQPAPPPAGPRLPIGASPGPTFDLAWIGKLVRVSEPDFAPDGKSLAVVVVHLDYENDLNVAELAAVDVASGKVRRLTHDRKSVSFPRWSPAGDRIAFLAQDGEKHNQIFILDMAGGEALQITHHPTSIQQLAWRPDGSALAFAAKDEVPKKTGADKFDDAFEVGDNDFLVKEKPAPTHLWMVSATATADPQDAPRRLTSGTWSLPVAFPPGPPASPIGFTPDGARLVYVRLENAYSGDRINSSLQMLDLASGKSEPITGHTRFAAFPVVSPDGKHVAYLYPRDGDEGSWDSHGVLRLSGRRAQSGRSGAHARCLPALDRMAEPVSAAGLTQHTPAGVTRGNPRLCSA